MGDRLKVRVTRHDDNSIKREITKDQEAITGTSYYHTLNQIAAVVDILGSIDISRPDFRGARDLQLCGVDMRSDFIDIINTGKDLLSSLRWEQGEK